jgi:hypothetical protein
MVIAYLFIIINALFIFSMCMAARRNCLFPETSYDTNQTELDLLEEISKSKIRVINTES